MKSAKEHSSEIGLMDSLWKRSMRKLFRDRIGMISLAVVGIYFLIALGVWVGWIGVGFDELITDGREAPSWNHWFGTNIIGQDVMARAFYSTRTAFEIGLVVSLCSVLAGSVFGSLAGYYRGKWIDECILWFMSVIECIPFYLFVAAIAFAMEEHPLAMHIAMISTLWTSTARYIRGEFIKLGSLDFTAAAKSIGVPTRRIVFKHLLPNTSHILIVQISLLFVTAIKTEVILSFLGLGVKDGISWGLMISESSDEIASGIFNNFFAASGFMLGLVFSFNLLADSLQDAFDPKKVQ